MIEVPFSADETPLVFLCQLEANERTADAWLLLDTGASMTMVSREVAWSLGFDLAATARMVEFASATSGQEAPVFTLDRIDLQGARQSDVEVIVHDLPPRLLFDGVIGLNFLCRFRSVLLDFERARLVIA